MFTVESTASAMKCAVITPIGPGHELYALDAADSVTAASAAGQGPFAEIMHIKVDDRNGELKPPRARNYGVELARTAGADWIYFLDATDILALDAFTNVAGNVATHDAIWGGIHELAADETRGVPRAGQLLEITRIDEVLANDPVNTLDIGHFVKIEVALATPFVAELDGGANFDYYLRLWRKCRCVKVARAFFYQRLAAGGPLARKAETDARRRAVERVICAHCTALDFRAEFAYRGERFQFHVANPFDLIHGSFLKGQFFESRELAVLETWVGIGAAIVEVGAYVGNHVVYYSRFMQPRTILVLEPNPEAIAGLRRNLQANGVACADLSRLGVGVAAANGTYDLISGGPANCGATRLVPSASGTVEAAPLDALIDGHVDFIKIDVEGMELDALAGAIGVIAQSRPKIMIEVFRPQAARFEKWLRQNRYRVAHRFDYVHAMNYLIEPAHA